MEHSFAGDVFIVGAPRSGTTWVQAMLSNHPSFASPPETSAFAALDAVEQRFRRVANGVGLSFALPRAELEEWMSELWLRIRRQLLDATPGATRILEKTPIHVQHMALVRRVVENPRFVVVVRAPEATVASMLHASRGWGANWAPDLVESAVVRWRRDVGAALRDTSEHDCITVRYEDLMAGPDAWQPLLRFLGIDSGWQLPPLDGSPLDTHRVALAAGVGPDDLRRAREGMQGFSFHSRSADDQPRLTGFERRYVRAHCSVEAAVLGYELPQVRLGPIDRCHVIARRAIRFARRIWTKRRPPKPGSAWSSPSTTQPRPSVNNSMR